MPEAINPIDQYLTLLDQTKKQFDQVLPGMEQSVNNILGLPPSNVFMNRATPLLQNAEKSAGNDLGLATFSPQRTNPQIDGTQGYVKDMLATTLSPDGIQASTAAASVRKIGFGAGPNKLNFDRYYNHPQFKNLGWNPYIDNEAIYNANSTWTDDFSRASTQWMSLVGLGAKQTFGNWDDLFSLNTKGDTKYAREMNRMMSIANSSRGGLGGFVTNMYGNSAYTFGVMGEILLEEFALWGATALTGGALGSIAAARTGSNLAKFMKAGKALENVEDVIQAGKTVAEQADDLASVSTAVNSISDVSNARKFWNGVADFINPFSQTGETLKNIQTGAKGFDAMSDWAKYSKTFGSFFRDVQLMNTALAESRLEGGMVQNDVFLELYDDYVNKNGKAPEGEDADKILQQSKLAGVRTTMANMPAILYSNKIVFDKALKGFRPFRDVGDNSLGKVVINYAKGSKKRIEGFIDTARPAEWFSKKNLKRVGNQFRPQNVAKHGLRYMSANLAEGLQEIYQEGIAKTMTDYYVETYASPERAGTAFFMEKLGEGFGEQISAQGAETFLSGFLMGGIVQAPQTVAFEYLPQAGKDFYERVKDKEAYDKKLAERKATQDRITNFINAVQADPKKFYDRIYENAQKQKDFSTLMAKAESVGDMKLHKDLSNDSIFTHVKTLMDQGYIDLFTDQIESFQQMKDNELLEAFGYDKNSGNADEYNKDMRGRLNSVLNKVNEIKANHEKYSTIKNPFNSKVLEEFIDYMGFEDAREMAIYNDYTYQQALKRMTKLFNEASGTKLGNAQSVQLSALFLSDSKSALGEDMLESQIKLLEDEAASYSQGNAEQKKLGEARKKQASQLRNFKEDFLNYRKEYKQAKRTAVNESVREEVKADTKASMTVQVGTNVEYTFKNGTKINGTVTKKTANKITIQYKDASGKTVSKEVSIKAKKLNILGGPQGQLPLDFEGNEIEAGIEARRKELQDRTREYLAAVSGLPVNSPEFNKIIEQVIDYAELSEDMSDAMAAVTFLNDPYNYSLAARQFSKAAKDAREIAKTKMQSSLDEFKNRMGVNELIQELFTRFNVFFDPEEIEALVKGDRVPSAFYKQNPKTNEFEEVSPSSPLYKQILEFLSEFEAENGYTLKGKVLGEAMAAGGYIINDMIEADKAPSLAQILKGLGLEPGKDTYTIPIMDVLKYIIKNRIGSVPSRKMIQNLMAAVKPDENMVISLTEKSGFTYSKETGIVIDPRFATKDYSTKIDDKFYTSTLTYLMIHPLTQKIVSDNQTDPAFKASIQSAMDAFKTYFDENPDQKQVYAEYVARMLSSQEAFVAEAFASQKGQEILALIPYKNTNRNLWQEFIKSLVNFFKKKFNIGNDVFNDTVLTEVLGIVSNKLAGKGVTAETTATGGIEIVSKPMVTRGTTLDSLKTTYPDLLNTLVSQYSVSTGKPGVANKDFANWFATSTEAVIDRIIADYNKKNNFTEPGPAAPTQAAPAPAPGPAPVSDEELFGDTGETGTPPSATTLAERIRTATAEELDNIQATTVNDDLKAENMTSDTFNKLIEKRRKELQPAGVTFDSVDPGTLLIMKDKTTYSINNGFAIVASKDEANRTVTITNPATMSQTVLTEDELLEQADFIKQTKASGVQAQPAEAPVEFTSEEKDLANQSTETATDDADLAKQIQEDLDAAKNKTAEERNNDFLNSLGCK
jgi:hypothetical protein